MEALVKENGVIAILEKKLQQIKAKEGTIYLVGPVHLPVTLDGETVMFKWYCWLKTDEAEEDLSLFISRLTKESLAEFQQSSVLVYGDFEHDDITLVRMHSICHTGDIFGSKRCDCGFQLKQSLRMIVEHGSGALFYLANHEGRGIGLFNKAMAYVLQENGFDTVDANLSLGFENDRRKYDDAIAVMKQLRSKPVKLITNNPKKINALQNAGMPIIGRIPLWGDISVYNEKYLKTKVERSGHLQEEGLFHE